VKALSIRDAVDVQAGLGGTGEQQQIARQRHSDSSVALKLAAGLDQLLRLSRDRALPLDLGVALRWGQGAAEIGHDGSDLLLAATALDAASR